MKRQRIFKFLTSILTLILTFSTLPAMAESYHQGGQINLRWSTSNMFLSPNSFIEQEFIPITNETVRDGAPFKWSSQYHLDFCWQGLNSLTDGSQRCGFVGFGIGSRNGNNYYGNFDFAIFNGIDFSILNTTPQVTCEKRNEAGFVNKTQTYYVTCWHGAVIRMNTPYVMRVQYDSTNYSGSENWWSASLTNKITGESIIIGKIKAVGNSYDENLNSLQTVSYYSGEPKKCDAVPILDTRVLPVKSSNASSVYISNWIDKCVRAVSTLSKDFPGYYSIRIGGDTPESRESGYVVQATSSKPSPSTSSKSESESSKPRAPIFSGIKIVGNTLNITVNLNSSQPDYVYLVAPKITNEGSQKILGTINGDTASWAIDIGSKQVSGLVPIKFLSSRNGLVSDETAIEYRFPDPLKSSSSISQIPISPSKITTKLLGNELLISAKVITKGNKAAEKAFMYSKVLGISKSQPLYGDFLAESVVFSIPISSNVLNKKIDINIVASNKIGNSKVSSATYFAPVPKSPINDQNIQTVICTKGSTVRTFASKICPPGWQTK